MHVSEFLRVSTTVGDLQQALAFYSEGLGFVPSDETRIDDPAWARLMGVDERISARCVRMQLGAQEIELVAFDPPGEPYPAIRAANDRWFQHIAIVVPDIQAAWRHLETLARSDISIDGPQRLPANTGGVSAVKFRDPEGHPLELLHLPLGVGNPVWHGTESTQPLGFDHSAIVVADVARSLAFYVDRLGLQISGRSLNQGAEQDRLDGLTGTLVDVIGLAPADHPTPHVELLHYREPAHTGDDVDVRAVDIASTRQVHRVDDIDGLVGRLKDADATFVSPGVVTLRDGVRAVAVRDPDGHMIMLTE